MHPEKGSKTPISLLQFTPEGGVASDAESGFLL